MANEIKIKQGTSLTWTSSGGDYTMDMASLANGAGRAGGEADFGATFPRRVRLSIELDFNSAPTAGNSVQVYWSSSHDGTDYDGEATGSDAAYSSTADLRRLQFVGLLVCSNDTDPQRQSFVFDLPARYGLPVVYNSSGQALTSTGTAQKVIVTPLLDEIQ